MKWLYFMGILCTRINLVFDNWAHSECGMFELKELSGYVFFSDIEEDDCYHRKQVNYRQLTLLLRSWLLSTHPKFGGTFADGSWDDFVWHCPCSVLLHMWVFKKMYFKSDFLCRRWSENDKWLEELKAAFKKLAAPSDNHLEIGGKEIASISILLTVDNKRRLGILAFRSCNVSKESVC